MKNPYSNIYSFNKRILKKTIKSLKNGNIASLPTETVYGLGGNAYSKKAINKIYKLKKRPKKNPLIIHYLNTKNLDKDVILNENFYKLYKKFCPGPITFVLNKNKNSKIKSVATANLKTIAIRFPKHSIVRSILKSIDFPLAMPSANISTGLSPVSAFDVFEEFGKKINIINGGKSKIGIESTVVDLTGKPKILRPGIISKSEIKKILRVNFSQKESKIKAPGMFKKHYSPGIPVILGGKPSCNNHAFIVFGKNYKKKRNYFNLSKNGSLKEAAANLYKVMRVIKKRGFRKIFIARIPKKNLGLAINDRLTRASK